MAEPPVFAVDVLAVRQNARWRPRTWRKKHNVVVGNLRAGSRAEFGQTAEAGLRGAGLGGSVSVT